MKPFLSLLTVLGFMFSGCTSDTTEPATTGSGTESAGSASTPGDDTSTGTEVTGTPLTLNADNTRIQFVGAHTGDDPNPRTGHFAAFQGTALVDGSQLTSVRVEIETGSLTTDIANLTNHLKSADFFDVQNHPRATFESTSIEPGNDGSVNITGNLTLLGVTRSITFPAQVSLEDGLKLSSEFVIDRTEFGMDYGLDRVEKEISMTVTING